jgi:general secretion pathway protein I
LAHRPFPTSRRWAKAHPARGFTLLEVLIALAIIALALTALVRSSGQQADALARERDQTLAHWVAANVLSQVRLREGFPPVGERDGSEHQGPHDWRWRLTVAPTEQATIRRLTVTVFEDDASEKPIASLAGFAGQR